MGRLTRLRAGVIAAVLTAVMALAGLVAPTSATAATPGTVPAKIVNGVEMDAARYEQRILDLLNRDRAKKGLRKLQRVKELDKVARSWSKNMAAKSRMYHNPRYASQIPSGWRLASENVAAGFRTPEDMYRGWYNSPGHYRNMFNPNFTHIGIGIAYGKWDTWVYPYGTQNFASYPKGRKLTATPTYVEPKTHKIPSDNGSSTRRIDDGGIGGSGNTYHLANSFSGKASYVFKYGNTGGRVYVGDWDGDGRDTLAYRIGNTFYIRNSNNAGDAHQVIRYGKTGDRVYVGDWDGDGRDTFAVRRGNTYYIKNSLSGGNADKVIRYGKAKDTVLIGDWNGDRRDTLAVRRGNQYHFKNRIAGGPADRVVYYGRAGDDVYVGDWNGDRRDTLAVRRGKEYHLKNSIRGGQADVVFRYGREKDTTLVGDWNGDRKDSIGIRR